MFGGDANYFIHERERVLIREKSNREFWGSCKRGAVSGEKRGEQTGPQQR